MFEEIYIQIINDFNCVKGFFDGYVCLNDKLKYKFNIDVVNGFLVCIYLFIGQWDEVVKVVLEVVKGYILMMDVKNYMGFNDILNIEWIWGYL